MIVEYIRYTVPAAAAEGFVEAYRKAGEVLEADPHCLAYEVARGMEQPEHFVVRIEWDSVEGHEQGFRAGPRFGEFFVKHNLHPNLFLQHALHHSGFAS